MTLNNSKTGIHQANRRSGFSLIEVAVALAIFVFGALAIVRIFPGALGVIQGSESRTVATRLAQSTIDRMAAAPQLVPDAIYSTLYNPTTGNYTAGTYPWVDFEGSINGTRTRNKALPQDDSVFYFGKSALGQFGRIRGEKQRVREGGYILTNYPYVYFTFTTPTPPPANLKVYREEEIEGVRITDDDGKLDFSNARLASTGEIFNDLPVGTGGEKYLPTRYPLPPLTAYTSATKRSEFEYYVSYRWKDNIGRVHGVLDEPLRFPDDNADWTGNIGKVYRSRSVVPAESNEIIVGPVTMRVRIPLPSPTMTTDDAIRGFVTLDPSMTGAIVSVDYNIHDWRWIVDDGAPVNMPARLTPPIATSVPNPVPRSVTLPTRFIRDTNIPSATVTNGLPPLYTVFLGRDSSTDALIRDYGEWDQSATTYNKIESVGTRVPAGSTTERLLNVNHKTGQVTFNNNGVIVPQSRVVYQAIDGWAQQLSVAAKNYMPFHEITSTAPVAYFPNEPWRTYFWTSADKPYLYFHPSEAGKTVLVSYEYVDNSSTPRPVSVTDRILTIDEKLIDRPTNVSANFMGSQPDGTTCTKVARVLLTELTDITKNADVRAIRAVKGASVQSRVAWLDGGQYTSTTIMGYRLATN